MQQPFITRRSRRKPSARVEFIDPQRNLELLAIPAVRAIVRRSRVSPVTAALLVELSGLSRQV
ncbi:hypothetical protein [Microvirga aerophila]|uniref:Uncharacterized protein n=1 Tax=Microvirga aerophila TaxID=670291 RepID=A0A512BYB2_9HYPH|nr:hypothetical protein [Microvirga aerophila]GEO16954.1 hypothetical protein MAE02_46500 [Microvirga aerophila]